MEGLICAQEVKKTFGRGDEKVEALRGVTLSVQPGEFLAVVGASGSGKSTLLHLLGGLDRPTAGSVLLEGRPLERLSDRDLAQVRRRRLGFVFQFFNLYPTMSAAENVALPWILDHRPESRFRPRCRELLETVGLADRAGHLPHQLSGGEMQRVAIARALAMDPPVILADEPTGNLDSTNGLLILDLLERQVREQGKTLVLVTHNPHAAVRADRVAHFGDGVVLSLVPD
jgi:putative ABC transport system ATP-binding protein